MVKFTFFDIQISNSGKSKSHPESHPIYRNISPKRSFGAEILSSSLSFLIDRFTWAAGLLRHTLTLGAPCHGRSAFERRNFLENPSSFHLFPLVPLVSCVEWLDK